MLPSAPCLASQRVRVINQIINTQSIKILHLLIWTLILILFIIHHKLIVAVVINNKKIKLNFKFKETLREDFLFSNKYFAD